MKAIKITLIIVAIFIVGYWIYGMYFAPLSDTERILSVSTTEDVLLSEAENQKILEVLKNNEEDVLLGETENQQILNVLNNN